MNDKLMHAIMGAAVAVCAAGLVWISQLVDTPTAMLAAAVAVGVAYELVQRLRNEGQADPLDAIATAAGGALAAFLAAFLWPF